MFIGRKLISRCILELRKPELPLYAIGLIGGGVIICLAVVIVRASFQAGLIPDFTAPLVLNHYYDVLLKPYFAEVALNTLAVGLGTTAVACFFAVPAAWLLIRTDLPLKRLFFLLMFLHLVMPAFLRVMGYIMLLSPGIGLVNEVLRLFIPVEWGPLSPYNLTTIAFLQGLTLTPLLFMMLAGALRLMDATYEEAASSCGAGRFEVSRRITLSFIRPALAAGVIYIFMLGVSLFETAALLGMPKAIHIFPTLMYLSLNPDVGVINFGIAAVYGVLLLIPLLIVLYFYQKVLRASYRYTAVTGKGYRPKMVSLGQLKWVGLSFMGVFFLLNFLLPFLAMLWASLVPYFQMPSLEVLQQLSLSAYKSGIGIILQGKVLTNTLQLVLLAGLFSVIVSLAISWIVIRSRLPGRYALDSVSMVPLAVPSAALALAIAYISLSLAGTIPIYGTVMALVIANTVSYIPFATRTITGAFIQIHRELEEAVQISGGSVLVTIRRVVVPVIFPALLFSFIWTALLAYREVTMALFLISPDNVVLASKIWTLWEQSDIVTAAAIGVMMVVAIGTLLFILLSLFPQFFRERML